MNPKISLIFACYNVANYLPALFELLNKQTYNNIEIIFVEDCSTDNKTRELLRNFKTKHTVILIENEKNIGVGYSRNKGIEIATGDYIGFPDPDDLFELDWISQVALAIEEKQPDVIISGIREEYEDDLSNIIYSKDILSQYSGYIESKQQDVLVDLEEKLLFGYTNNKFYRKCILTNINLKYKNMALKEDLEFNYHFFLKAHNFYILNQPYYIYKKRNNSSLTAKYVKEYFNIHMDTIFMLNDLFSKKGNLTNKATQLLVNHFYRYFLSAVERNTSPLSKMSFRQQINWVNQVKNNKRYEEFFRKQNLLTGKMKYISKLFTSDIATVSVGYIVALIKKYLPIIFTKLKQN